MKSFYIIIFICLASCSAKLTKPPVSNFESENMHHRWQVLQMADAGTPATNIFLDFTNIYTTYATTSCDSVTFTPRYFYNNKISIDNISTIYNHCGNELHQQLINNLSRAAFYRLHGKDSMQLTDGSGQPLFTAIRQSFNDHSPAKKWLITSMLNVKNKRIKKLQPVLDLRNAAASTVTFGCGTIGFNTNISGDFVMTIKQVQPPAAKCNNTAVPEEVLVKLLPRTARYQVINGVLKLFDADNFILLEAAEIR